MSQIQPLPADVVSALPARLVQSSWVEHGPFAYWIIDALRPALTVELGSHWGYSFCCFCEQVQRARIDGRVIAVDTWRGDEHAGIYDDTVFRDLSRYVARHYSRIAEMKRMTFAEALPSVADGSVDLLHIDGRHYFEDVVEDYTSWIPKLSDRAVVLFHDTQVRDNNFGVYKFWAELQSRHPTFEFHHGFGLGVLGYGPAIPPPVSALFAQATDVAAAEVTRAAFAAAGHRVAVSWQRKSKKKRKLLRLGRKVRRLVFGKPVGGK